MPVDARFEDGGARPVALYAQDSDDLQIISALVQDSIFPATEMTWDKTRRRFAILLNRFRWEALPREKSGKQEYERVQSVLLFGDVLNVSSQGVTPGDPDTILSLLSIAFHPGPDGTGRVELVLAGDGAIALDVEALDASLKDVTRPYVAPSGKVPAHDV